MGWYVLGAVVVMYAIVVTVVLWELLDKFSLVKQKKDIYRQQADNLESQMDEMLAKHSKRFDELFAELATAKRELEVVSNQYDDVQSQRVELAKQKDDMHAELIAVRRALANMKEDLVTANLLAAQRGDNLKVLQELLNEQKKIIIAFNQIREICNT